MHHLHNSCSGCHCRVKYTQSAVDVCTTPHNTITCMSHAQLLSTSYISNFCRALLLTLCSHVVCLMHASQMYAHGSQVALPTDPVSKKEAADQLHCITGGWTAQQGSSFYYLMHKPYQACAWSWATRVHISCPYLLMHCWCMAEQEMGTHHRAVLLAAEHEHITTLCPGTL